MNSNLEERYESLKKSVNHALKMFCNKIEEMKLEVKDLKSKMKSEKDCCTECNCKKENQNLKEKVDRIENNFSSCFEKEGLKSIENDIQNIKEQQSENIREIRNLDEKINSLVNEHDIVQETANFCKESIINIGAKVESIQIHHQDVELNQKKKAMECGNCDKSWDKNIFLCN